MKIVQVFNRYRSLLGGEETVVRNTVDLLQRRGHECSLLLKSSRQLDQSLWGKARAFCSGVYSVSAYREMTEYLRRERPDVVHAHNIYPLFSPSVLVACRRAGVPVVMSTHNYVLTCPVVEHMQGGQVCEKCLGGKEYWCVLKNCRGNLAESVAYAARSMTARKLDLFRDNVSVHIVLSTFAKQRLVRAGFDEQRIVVLPNVVASDEQPISTSGEYVAFSGRMSREKGVGVLLEAAARLSDVPFRLAGDGPLLERLESRAPGNARFVHRVPRTEMASFYRRARFLVIPSLWFEGCPLVVSEAMIRGLPVIGSRIGGLPELIDDGVTGLLFEPGNVAELASQVRRLWNDPGLRQRMGEAGRRKALQDYGEERYYERLMGGYRQALALNGGAHAVAV